LEPAGRSVRVGERPNRGLRVRAERVLVDRLEERLGVVDVDDPGSAAAGGEPRGRVEPVGIAVAPLLPGREQRRKQRGRRGDVRFRDDEEAHLVTSCVRTTTDRSCARASAGASVPVPTCGRAVLNSQPRPCESAYVVAAVRAARPETPTLL